MSSPPIGVEDYTRIHAVIRGVLDGARARTTGACVFFSLAGSFLLHSYFGLTAKAACGAAVFGLGGNPPDVLAFARLDGNDLVSDDNAFHCWLQCGDWIIDFMAPIFPENAAQRGFKRPVPIRSLIKRSSDLTDQVGVFAGGVMLEPNFELSRRQVENSMSRQDVHELIKQCASWFRRHPEPISALTTNDRKGRPQLLQLRLPVLEGAW